MVVLYIVFYFDGSSAEDAISYTDRDRAVRACKEYDRHFRKKDIIEVNDPLFEEDRPEKQVVCVRCWVSSKHKDDPLWILNISYDDEPGSHGPSHRIHLGDEEEVRSELKLCYSDEHNRKDSDMDECLECKNGSKKKCFRQFYKDFCENGGAEISWDYYATRISVQKHK
jgi:hypothetical protein